MPKTCSRQLLESEEAQHQFCELRLNSFNISVWIKEQTEKRKRRKDWNKTKSITQDNKKEMNPFWTRAATLNSVAGPGAAMKKARKISNFYWEGNRKINNFYWEGPRKICNFCWEGPRKISSFYWEGPRKINNNYWDGPRKISNFYWEGPRKISNFYLAFSNSSVSLTLVLTLQDDWSITSVRNVFIQ